MTKYILRMAFLLIAAGLAGGLCAFLIERESVAIGSVFGFALALGILVVHFFCRNRLTREEPSKWIAAILASIISGIIGSVAVSLLTAWNPLAFAHMMGFSVVLHLAYQTRWRFGVTGFLAAVVVAAALCFLSAQVIGAMFAVFWLAVVALIDPAWSFERWKKCWPGKAAEGKACALGK